MYKVTKNPSKWTRVPLCGMLFALLLCGSQSAQPVLAQSSGLRVIVESILENGLLTVSATSETGKVLMQVTNNASYWLDFNIDPQGMAQVRPRDEDSTVLHKMGLIPPETSVAYEVDFVSGGALVVKANCYEPN